jgi:anti-sigma-K factor RskA
MGFMRLIGMPINDPLQEQYQLWIIDPLRDDEPVDGGVFDIAESGEVIVPIQAKLHVTKPAAFAITIEKPGGVVVSTQERLPLLAVVP